MSAQSEDGRHEGYVAHLFADGISGSARANGGPIANVLPDGTALDWAERETRGAEEIVGWFATCTDEDGRECWRGPVWKRVRTREEHDPDRRRIYVPSGPHALMPDEYETLAMDDCYRHYAPFAAVQPVERAAAEVSAAPRGSPDRPRTNAGRASPDSAPRLKCPRNPRFGRGENRKAVVGAGVDGAGGTAAGTAAGCAGGDIDFARAEGGGG